MSDVLSSMRFSPPAVFAACSPGAYTQSGRPRKSVESRRLCRKRQDMALVRRNTAIEGIEINLFHRAGPAAFGDLEPAIEVRREARPRRAEPRVDTARTPFLGALAHLVRREEPGRFGARQFAFVRRRAAVGEADAAGVFHLRARMP